MPDVSNWLSDSQSTVLDGMNSGRTPELISESQAALLRNVSIRGGRVRSRPRFVLRGVIPNLGAVPSVGIVQGAAIFSKTGTMLISIAGYVFEVNVDSFFPVKLLSTERNNPKLPRVWFCETAGSIVMQDSQSKPLIYDGATARRAESDEVPVGRAMAFGNGRLAVVVNGGRDVRLGDIRKPEHQSELKFTETFSLNGGGDFAFPENVEALAVLPVVDTGSGQGSLIVGCERSVHSLKTHITQRDLWGEVAFQTVVLPNRGIVGGSAVVAVNQDLYFRSSDGLRSLRTSTADYSAPGLAPLSVEVRHRFDYDTPFLLKDAQVVYFDNRVLCTHSPFIHGPRSLAQGLIALNFDAISGRGEKSSPAFDGEWDGLQISSVVTGRIRGVERCFIVSGRFIYEVLPEAADQSHPNADSPTQVTETRVLFGDSPATTKVLRRADLQFSNIRTALEVRVYFRPVGYGAWTKWDEFTVSAPTGGSWNQRVRPQSRQRLSTRSVPEAPQNPNTGAPVSVGTGFQVRVEFEGLAHLDKVTVFQERTDFSPYAANPGIGDSSGPTTLAAGQIEPAFWNTFPVSPLSGIV
jgi:hypothetical protein